MTSAIKKLLKLTGIQPIPKAKMKYAIKTVAKCNAVACTKLNFKFS